MSCYAASTNGCLHLRYRAFAPRCLGSMGCGSLQQSSANRMPARIANHFLCSCIYDRISMDHESAINYYYIIINSFSAGVRHRHPVTVCRVSLMTGSMRPVWVLQHQRGAQYSAVEWTKARVAVRNVVAPAPQPEPASHLKSARCDLNFLQSDSRCRQYMRVLSNITPMYVGYEQKGRLSLLWLTFSSRLASLLRQKIANAAFVVLGINFQFWRYSPVVAMSLLSTPSHACQSPSACMIARLLAYAYFLETVAGKSEV